MTSLKKLFIFAFLFFLTSCVNEKNRAHIIFTLENSKYDVSNFKICETDYGFLISLEEILQQEITSQKVKSIFVINGDKKVEIKTFNILYTPPENFSHKTPTKPNGSIAFFKTDNDLTIDVLSDNKQELKNLIGEDKILNCASH